MPEKFFVQVHPERPECGANSGGVGFNEQPEKFWRDNLSPRCDQDILDFIGIAEVGAFIRSERGLFLFRSK